MPLQGTFDVLPFADALELMASRAASGRLHVRSRSTGVNIYLEKGRLVGADVGDHAGSGPGAEDVRSWLVDVCFELIEADRGSFEFTPDLTGMGPPTMSNEVSEVLDAARRQLEAWRDIQTVIPSLDVHPGLVAVLAADEVTLSREQWAVLSTLDGRRSIRAVARLLDHSDYNVSRTLKSLIEAGVVEMDGPARQPLGAGSEATVFLDDAVFVGDTVALEDAKSGAVTTIGIDTPGSGATTTGGGNGATADRAPQSSPDGVGRLTAGSPEGAIPGTAAHPDSAETSSTDGHDDSIWRFDVEERPAAGPPYQAPAERRRTVTSPPAVPYRTPAMPVFAPNPAASSVRRKGFLGGWKSRPPRT